MPDEPTAVLRFRWMEQEYALRLADDASLGLTPREHGRIRRLTGLATQEWFEAFRKADSEVIAALAIVAMERAGQEPDVDAVMTSLAPPTLLPPEPADPTLDAAAGVEADTPQPIAMIPSGTGAHT